MAQLALVAASCGAVACLVLGRRRRSGPRVVNDAETWARAQRESGQLDGGLFAFYSSVTKAITTRPELMALPIDDHAIVRGHAVFDTCTLADGHLYRAQIHLERLMASAKTARLPLPFIGDEAQNIARMLEIIRAVCIASGRRDADVRYWLSAGPGNLGLTPDGCTPAFYVVCSPPLRGAATVMRRARASRSRGPRSRAPRARSSSSAASRSPRG